MEKEQATSDQQRPAKVLRRETLTEGLLGRIQQSGTEIMQWFALEDILNSGQVQSDFVRAFLWER